MDSPAADVELLAQPLALRCGLSLPNRLLKSSTSEYLAGPDGLPTERHVRVYRAWAEGGVGVILTGNVMIDGRHREAAGNMVLEADTPLGPFEALAAAISSPGAVALIQVNHPGRQSPRNINRAPVAPSAVRLRRGGYGFIAPRALTEPEIHEIITRFATTARRAVEAGFHGVQVHAAHGYLLSQFLAPNLNLREDGWGGPNRGRLLLEVVRAVRAAVGPGRVLAVKLNSNDLSRGGVDAACAAATVAALDAEGVDLIELSGGTYEVDATLGRRDHPEREAYFLDFAEACRRAIGAPLALTGGFRSRAAMAGALRGGAVDVVGLARPLILEPDLPRQLLDPALPDVRAMEASPPGRGLPQLAAAMELAWYVEAMTARAEQRAAQTSWWSAFTGAARHFL